MRMNLNRSDSSVTCEKVAEVYYVRYLIHLHRFTVTESQIKIVHLGISFCHGAISSSEIRLSVRTSDTFLKL